MSGLPSHSQAYQPSYEQLLRPMGIQEYCPHYVPGSPIWLNEGIYLKSYYGSLYNLRNIP